MSRKDVSCRFFGSSKGCYKGNDCLFSHSNPNSIPLCRFGDACRYGQNCNFRHQVFPVTNDTPKKAVNQVILIISFILHYFSYNFYRILTKKNKQQIPKNPKIKDNKPKPKPKQNKKSKQKKKSKPLSKKQKKIKELRNTVNDLDKVNSFIF